MVDFSAFVDEFEKLAGVKDEARRYAQHAALNLGQAARDARYLTRHPEAKGSIASLKKRVPSLGTNLGYAVLPPRLHHTAKQLDEDKAKSLKELFLKGYKPWKHK